MQQCLLHYLPNSLFIQLPVCTVRERLLFFPVFRKIILNSFALSKLSRFSLHYECLKRNEEFAVKVFNDVPYEEKILGKSWPVRAGNYTL